MKNPQIIAVAAGMVALGLAVAVPTMMWSPAVAAALPTAAEEAIACAEGAPAAALEVAGSRVRGVSAADIVAAAGDLSDPANRARIAPLLERLEAAERRAARQRARELGLPVRIKTADGSVRELAKFEGDKPLYLTVHRAAAGQRDDEGAEALPEALH